MNANPDPLLNFLQLFWQVIQVITSIVLLVYAYLQVRYVRAHDAFLQRRLRKERETPAPSESKGASMASPQVVEQEQQHSPNQ